ncbi:hypothetical protein KBY84_13915 [Cyanobium sp. N.Huapi 1H5]|nr:hypothetical protein [Cyanobium sp. N.Huapi 1H5]MCP9838594.1 hypothetical protein [Cyanobium sp. N.Huapi 1H5]
MDSAILKLGFDPLPESIRWVGIADGQPWVINTEISLFLLLFPTTVP